MSISPNSTIFPLKDNNTKIPNNNILRQSHSNDASSINGYCANHYRKKAKFFYRNEKGGISPFVCSKCALVKALNGIKIEKVLTNEAKSRKSSTDTFLSRLSFLKNCCSSVSCLFSEKLASLPSVHFQCHERILEIFDKIERILNFEKTSFFVENRFLLEKRRSLLENRINELREIGGEVEKWESDIIQNYEKIVEKIEMMPFREIMGRYGEKIKGFEETLCIAKQDIKLNFDDFLTISETGIDKIENILKGIFTFKNEKSLIEEVPNHKLNKENLENKENKNYENKENINSTMENKLVSRPPLMMNTCKALSTLIGKNKNWKKKNEGLERTTLKSVDGDSFKKNITNINGMKKN